MEVATFLVSLKSEKPMNLNWPAAGTPASRRLRVDKYQAFNRWLVDSRSKAGTRMLIDPLNGLFLSTVG
jgi:hypothetical protein